MHNEHVYKYWRWVGWCCKDKHMSMIDFYYHWSKVERDNQLKYSGVVSDG